MNTTIEREKINLIKRVLRTVILIILGALLGMLLGVLILQITFAATGHSAGNTNVTIAGFAYSPKQAVVRVGDTVTWTNNDSAPHTVTASDASFDSGTLGQGGVYSRTFGATGVFSYFCAIHPSMVGSVRVISEALVHLPLVVRAGQANAPPAPPGPPVVGAGGRWSDPATWGGTLPKAGAAVVIPAGKTIILDVSPPPLASVSVDGQLIFEDGKDLELTAGWIMVHGLFQIGTEQQPHRSKATITLTGTNEQENVMGEGRMAMGTKFLGAMMGGRIELHGARRDAISFTQLVAHANPGDTTITLKDAVNWRAGDRIVIAPSGFNALEAELVTITAVNGNRVSFTPALRHRHFGQTQTFEGRVLDSRAHVGLLTRDIVIRGAPDSDASQFGGHVMIMPGSVARIEGVEFYKMGQMGHIGRYPLHWHLVDRMSQGGVTGNGQYAKNNSFHDSFQRAINLHGTSSVLVEGNVAFNIHNHAIVVAESGDEENNIIRNNLVVLVKPPLPGQEAFKPSRPFDGLDHGATLQNEQKSSAFWTRNTNNVFTGNVAAGSIDGNGFFFDGQLQIDPAVPPTDPEMRDLWEILDIAVQKPARTVSFTHNIAYGHCTWERNDAGQLTKIVFPPVSFYQGATTAHGLLVQEAANVLRRQPNPTTDLVFSDFTAYKNCKSGVWLETSREILRNSIVADNSAAFIPEKEPRVENFVAIGRSANDIGGQNYLQLGFVWNDAIEPGFRLTNATFVNIKGAIVFTDDFLVGGGQVSGVRLVNSLPLAASADLRGSSMGHLLDADGSLTGRGSPTRVSINRLNAQSSPFVAPMFDAQAGTSGPTTFTYYFTPGP
ncbi:MAG: G8 domain-containing protein [Anaerolineae bacterium]|nr:right-handed parallel beta-helix repeat-containing protein [Candidatus Roseilinea sp.]MDW8451241.1 G8 domain-containing protein [Anaerolineae bacterium]